MHILQKIEHEDGDKEIYCNNCPTVAKYRIQLGLSVLRLCEKCLGTIIKEIKFYGVEENNEHNPQENGIMHEGSLIWTPKGGIDQIRRDRNCKNANYFFNESTVHNDLPFQSETQKRLIGS